MEENKNTTLNYSDAKLSKKFLSSFFDKGILLILVLLLFEVVVRPITNVVPSVSNNLNRMQELTTEIYDNYFETHLVEYSNNEEVASKKMIDNLLMSITKSSLIYHGNDKYNNYGLYLNAEEANYSENSNDFIYFYNVIYKVNNKENYENFDENLSYDFSYFFSNFIKNPAESQYFLEISVDEKALILTNEASDDLANYLFLANYNEEIEKTYNDVFNIYLEALTSSRNDYFSNNLTYKELRNNYDEIYDNYALTLVVELVLIYVFCSLIMYLLPLFILKKYGGIGNRILSLSYVNYFNDQKIKFYQIIIKTFIEIIQNLYILGLSGLLVFGGVSILFESFGIINIFALSIIGLVISLASFIIYFVNKKHVGLSALASLINVKDLKVLEVKEENGEN